MPAIALVSTRFRASPQLQAGLAVYDPGMCADIYRTGKANTFLLVPRGAGLDTVPPEVLKETGHPVFMSTRELCDPLLSIDTTLLQSQLASQGFALRRA